MMLLMSYLFKTIVTGACVFEKKHGINGPNNGQMDISDMGAVGGEGPSTKSITGCTIAKIGDVTNVNVSTNIIKICCF